VERDMTHIQVVRIKKLTGKNIIEVAARHNHREIASERGADSHIDAEQTGFNRVLHGDGTAAGVANTAQVLMDNAGVKALRKDSVRALEIIFCLPPDSTIDHAGFFRDSLAWTEEYFQAPVISAVVHYDEAAPHCHVLVLPLVCGRMIGSRLMGNRAKLQALQGDFHAKVGQRYELTRQAAQKRLSAPVRQQALDAAFNLLQVNGGLNDAILKALLAPHLQNPEPLLLALGLEMPKQKVKGTFAGVMTKPTKPEKKQNSIGFDDMKPISFDGAQVPKKEQSLCSVGFGKSAPSIPPTKPLQTTAPPPQVIAVTPTVEQQGTDDNAGDFIRERDTDNAASQWNGELGEFIKPLPIQTSVKLFVVKSFTAKLEASRKAMKA
jgi:hypothetical protein